LPEGVLFGVGVGPGDPELLTLKAVNVLKRADVVCIPQSHRHKESTAYAIASEHLPQEYNLLALFFPMTRVREELEKSWEQSCAKVREQLELGKRVVFLTIGDPMLYSTYIYLSKQLQEEGYRTEIVPGIPSFCAAAAAAGFPLGEGEGKIAIIPWGPDTKASPQELKQFDNLVLMKVSPYLETIREALAEAGFLKDSVFVDKCGYEEEEIRDFSSLNDKEKTREFSYFSLILARRERS